MCQNVIKAKCNFYADDAVLYCSAPSLTSAIEDLQYAFKIIQKHLHKLRRKWHAFLNQGKQIMLVKLLH